MADYHVLFSAAWGCDECKPDADSHAMRSEFTYGGYRVSSIAGGYVARPADEQEESGFSSETGETVTAIFELSSSRIQVIIEAIDLMDDAVAFGEEAPPFFKAWMRDGSNGRINLDLYTRINRADLYRSMVHDLVDQHKLSVRLEVTSDLCPIDGERETYEVLEVASEDDDVFRRLAIPPYGKDASCTTFWESAYRAITQKYGVFAASDPSL